MNPMKGWRADTTTIMRAITVGVTRRLHLDQTGGEATMKAMVTAGVVTDGMTAEMTTAVHLGDPLGAEHLRHHHPPEEPAGIEVEMRVRAEMKTRDPLVRVDHDQLIGRPMGDPTTLLGTGEPLQERTRSMPSTSPRYYR